MTTITIIIDGQPVTIDKPPAEPRDFSSIGYEFVQSHTGLSHQNGEKKGYVVTTYDGWAIACTCPDFNFRQRVCKHMTQDVGCIARIGDLLT